MKLFNRIKAPNSEYLSKNGFYLPLGAHINNKKQEFIVNKLLNHLN